MQKFLIFFFTILSTAFADDCTYNYGKSISMIENAMDCRTSIMVLATCPFGGSADFGLINAIQKKCSFEIHSHQKVAVKQFLSCERMCNDEVYNCISNKALCKLKVISNLLPFSP